MRKIIFDKKLLKFNGHTFTEVASGLALGLMLAIFIDVFIYGV